MSVLSLPIPSGGSGIPSGFIGMWSGSEVPDGWALCDGTNGTPDLRGRFVLGQSETHEIGDTGGEEEVELTVEQMPEHRHTYTSMIGQTRAVTTNGTTNVSTSSVTTGNTSLSGSSQPHPNMPPYCVLAYIMKL